MGGLPGPNDPISRANFTLARNDPAVFYKSFAGCLTSPNWRYDFTKDFVAEPSSSGGPATQLTKNPDLIDCVAAPTDGQGAPSFKLVPVADGQARTWFTLSLGGVPGDKSTYMQVDIDVPGVSYASARTGSVIGSQPFWAPPGTRATVTARNLSTGTEQSCQVDFAENLSYTVVETNPPCSWLPAGEQTGGDIGVGSFK